MSAARKMVQLSSETWERLRREIDGMLVYAEQGGEVDLADNLDNPNPRCLPISYDAFIAHLLDQRERHRERRKKHRAGKKTARRTRSSSQREEGGTP